MLSSNPTMPDRTAAPVQTRTDHQTPVVADTAAKKCGQDTPTAISTEWALCDGIVAQALRKPIRSAKIPAKTKR
jgi:hypothetical protein